jgi:IclR family transcriptional regulator, acetate operon repressor
MAIAVKRALSLLDLFSESSPEIGLSDAARLSGHDKATVHRLLNTLRESELVEQDQTSKLYRLGPAVLRLARVREKSFPLVSVVQPLLNRLTQRTGETSHLSVYTGNALVVVASCESPRPNHVSLRQSETLPLHATASGHAFLAFAAPEVLKTAMEQPLAAFTSWTLTTPDQMRKAVLAAKTNGFAVVDQSYDDDVHGVAVPVFGRNGTTAIGALAVASPRHRTTAAVQAQILIEVQATAELLSRRMGN